MTCRYRCMMYYAHMKTYMCYATYLHEDIHVLCNIFAWWYTGIGNVFTLCNMSSMCMKIYMYYVIYEHEEKCIYYVIDIHEICRSSVIYVSGDICVLCDIFAWDVHVSCSIFTWRYKCIMLYITWRYTANYTCIM